MAYNLDAIPTGGVLRPPRIILLGVEKIGKTTWASQFGQPNKPALIPIVGEEGADDPTIQEACRVFPVCRTLDNVIGWLQALREQQHDHGAAILDSSSALEPLIFENLCQTVGDKNGSPCKSIEEVMGGYYKGYTAAADTWRAITQWLDILRTERNMASIIIGHVKVKRFDDPTAESYDQYQWDINEKASSLLFRWADLILFANRKTIVKSEDVGFNKEVKRGIEIGDQRFVYTQKRPAHPGGGRGVFGRIPYELPFDMPSFVQAVANASQ